MYKSVEEVITRLSYLSKITKKKNIYYLKVYKYFK